MNLPVSSRIDEMIMSARAKEKQIPNKPSSELLQSCCPQQVPDKFSEEAKHDQNGLKEISRGRIAPAFSLLSAIRYMGSLRYKKADGGEPKAIRNMIGPTAILHNRRRSSAANYSAASPDEDDSRSVSPAPTTLNNPRPPSPQVICSGIAACESEEGAYLFRAGRKSLTKNIG